MSANLQARLKAHVKEKQKAAKAKSRNLGGSETDVWDRTGVGAWTWFNSRWPDSPKIMRRADVQRAFYGEYNEDPC